MNQYRIGVPFKGFVSAEKMYSRANAERTINWFINGIKGPMWDYSQIGNIDSCRFHTYTHPKGE